MKDLETHAAGCDDLVNRWTNDGRVSTSDQHRAWLQRSAEAWDQRSDCVDLAVEDARTGVPVGLVGIQRGLDCLESGDVNLTYTVYTGHRGQGYATQATRAAMGITQQWWHVRRFVIRCDPENVASGAVARRLGFAFVGTITEPDGWCGDRYVREVEPHPQNER